MSQFSRSFPQFSRNFPQFFRNWFWTSPPQPQFPPPPLHVALPNTSCDAPYTPPLGKERY